MSSIPGSPAELVQQPPADRSPLGSRCGPQDERDSEPFDDLLLLEAVSALPRERQPCLRCLCAQPSISRQVVGLTDEPPRSSEPELVSLVLEHRDRVLGDLDQLLGRDVGFVKEESQEPALHESVRSQSWISRRDRLLQDRVRPAQVGGTLDRADVRDEIDPQGIVVREKRGRS